MFRRKMRIIFFMLFTPLAVGIMLNIIIDIGKILHESGVLDFPPEAVLEVPKCNNGYYWDPRKESECLSVGYSILGDSSDMNDPKYQKYHDLMKIFSKNNHFEYNKDVKPLTVGKQKDLLKYIDGNKNKTMYAVAFCHEEWLEELEFNTVAKNDDMYNFNKTVEERSALKVNKLSWQFPCKFEHSNHGEKDLWVYFMYYNMTLAPSNVYTSIDKPMKKDMNLLSLKLGIDNALLEYKAK